MSTTPDTPRPDDGTSDADSAIGESGSPSPDVPGAEIGMSEDEGSSFEPEEDPEAQG